MNFVIVEIDRQGPTDTSVAWVWMNRPEVHNAFDETLIAEPTAALKELDGDDNVRAIVLGGRVKDFSAGADLNWMKRQGAASMEENLADAHRLADLFDETARCIAQLRVTPEAREGLTALPEKRTPYWIRN